MPALPQSLRSAWDMLDAELDCWANDGRTAWFWWRDDDAADETPPLERLLGLQHTTAVPLTIAVVPRHATQALADRLNARPAVTAVQHGFAHVSHTAAGEKKCEFPLSRSLENCLQDLQSGQATMRRLFPRQNRQVLVPPWNRFPEQMSVNLPALGFTAISGFQLRRRYWVASGLVQLNTHIDPVDWKGQDSIAGCGLALTATVQGLQAMRIGVAPQQPLGLLTHHLRHDERGWDFLATFLDRILTHPAGGWLNLDAALRLGLPDPDVMPAS